MTLDFLSNPYFWASLVLGVIAMMPRVLYVAEKLDAAATPHEVKPTPVQRLCLLIPGMCVLFMVLAFGDLAAGVALVLAYLAAFVVMILFSRVRTPT